MNNDIAISVRNISKAYTIRHNAEQHTMLSEAIMHTLRNPLRRQEKETFWALKDISFDVKKGDVVGIIGRNGAGKSTLLKILSRITEPTTGEILMDGRVGSLLEVGTGFHPELTGRENIYLNGAILGMKRREIDRHFDAIVDFAGVEQFLDTPVKRYSSGMYVRLAFAVAAHLNPEILIVDEVLSVGDAEFQKKCLGKMGEVAKSGRTVLFVSHNMAAVRRLCKSAFIIKAGALIHSGEALHVVRQYSSELHEANYAARVMFTKPKDAILWMNWAEIITHGVPVLGFDMGQPNTIRVGFEAIQSELPILGAVIKDQDGNQLLNISARYAGYKTEIIEKRRIGVVVCDTGILPLTAGEYRITLYIGIAGHDTHIIEDALTFRVYECDAWGNGYIPTAQAGALWWPAKYDILSV